MKLARRQSRRTAVLQSRNELKKTDLPNFSQGSWAVLFACGEFYCFAVIFGLCRVIFASQVKWRIKYHCEAKPNNITTRHSRIISLQRSWNITVVFSADLCYNGTNKKPRPLGEVAVKPPERENGGSIPSHPLSRELSQWESLRTCNRRGMALPDTFVIQGRNLR